MIPSCCHLLAFREWWLLSPEKWCRSFSRVRSGLCSRAAWSMLSVSHQGCPGSGGLHEDHSVGSDFCLCTMAPCLTHLLLLCKARQSHLPFASFRLRCIARVAPLPSQRSSDMSVWVIRHSGKCWGADIFNTHSWRGSVLIHLLI